MRIARVFVLIFLVSVGSAQKLDNHQVPAADNQHASVPHNQHSPAPHNQHAPAPDNEHVPDPDNQHAHAPDNQHAPSSDETESSSSSSSSSSNNNSTVEHEEPDLEVAHDEESTDLHETMGEDKEGGQSRAFIARLPHHEGGSGESSGNAEEAEAAAPQNFMINEHEEERNETGEGDAEDEERLNGEMAEENDDMNERGGEDDNENAQYHHRGSGYNETFEHEHESAEHNGTAEIEDDAEEDNRQQGSFSPTADEGNDDSEVYGDKNDPELGQVSHINPHVPTETRDHPFGQPISRFLSPTPAGIVLPTHAPLRSRLPDWGALSRHGDRSGAHHDGRVLNQEASSNAGGGEAQYFNNNADGSSQRVAQPNNAVADDTSGVKQDASEVENEGRGEQTSARGDIANDQVTPPSDHSAYDENRQLQRIVLLCQRTLSNVLPPFIDALPETIKPQVVAVYQQRINATKKCCGLATVSEQANCLDDLQAERMEKLCASQTEAVQGNSPVTLCCPLTDVREKRECFKSTMKLSLTSRQKRDTGVAPVSDIVQTGVGIILKEHTKPLRADRHLDVMCARVAEANTTHQLSLDHLNDIDKSTAQAVLAGRRNQTMACCKLKEEERFQCLENMRRDRYERVCDGKEPLSFGPHASDRPIKITEECCKLQGNTRFLCFENSKVLPHHRRPGTRGSHGKAGECCVAGKEFVQSVPETTVVGADDCTRAAQQYVPVNQQPKHCPEIFTSCCVRAAVFRTQRKSHSSPPTAV